ncbi:speckle-type POZ protein-like A [Planococcus citri]|uniref:speckle-type POZ protein-like A n=1 Tax=Planococcus citri TaxID=170843 RepID=UPI0031F734D2
MSNSSPQKFNAKLLWEIDQFSNVCAEGQSSRLKSKPFYNCEEDSILKWHLVLTPSGNGPNDSVFFELCCDSVTPVEKYTALSGDVEIAFIGNSLPLTGTRKTWFHIASVDDNKLHGVPFHFNFSELDQMTFENKISISCKVGYTRKDIMDRNLVELDKCSLSRDFEQIQTDQYLSDVTISVKGKDYKAHKVILAARSSVFKSMFRTDMQESKGNHITITDINEDVFDEMYNFIYTGKTKNLEVLAFELLPAADKYDLEELKNACGRILLRKLSAQNVGKILILADMHNVEELKKNALRFIKANKTDCEEFTNKNSDFWNDLMSRPMLMKDLVWYLNFNTESFNRDEA